MWTGEISAKLNLSCRYAVCASSPKLLVSKPDSLEALTLTTYCRYPRQVRTLHSSRICLLAASTLLYSQACSIFSGQLHQRASISNQHELTFYSTHSIKHSMSEKPDAFVTAFTRTSRNQSACTDQAVTTIYPSTMHLMRPNWHRYSLTALIATNVRRPVLHSMFVDVGSPGVSFARIVPEFIVLSHVYQSE